MGSKTNKETIKKKIPRQNVSNALTITQSWSTQVNLYLNIHLENLPHTTNEMNKSYKHWHRLNQNEIINFSQQKKI